MLHRPVLVLLAAALAASVAAAPVTDEGVMAVDTCEPGPDAYALTLDAHDLCEVTMQVTAGGTAAPAVTATLRMADDTVPASVYSTLWSVGDCIFQFHHEDDAFAATGVTSPRTRLIVGCGESERVCNVTGTGFVPVKEAGCRWVYRDGSASVDVTPPTVNGATVAFAAVLDGELAPYAALFEPGATLQQRGAYVAPDAPFFTDGAVGSVFVCGVLDDCTYVGGDLVLGGGTLTLSEPAQP